MTKNSLGKEKKIPWQQQRFSTVMRSINLNRQQIQNLTEQDVSGSSRFRGCEPFLGLRLQLTGAAPSWHTVNWVFSECSHFNGAALIFSAQVCRFLIIMEHITGNKSFIKANTHPQSKLWLPPPHRNGTSQGLLQRPFTPISHPSNVHPFHPGIKKCHLQGNSKSQSALACTGKPQPFWPHFSWWQLTFPHGTTC